MSSHLRALAWLGACFAASALLYLLLWELAGEAALRRLGYELWLRNSTDDLVVAFRVRAVRMAYEIAVPLLVGSIGAAAGWRWRRARRRRA